MRAIGVASLTSPAPRARLSRTRNCGPSSCCGAECGTRQSRSLREYLRWTSGLPRRTSHCSRRSVRHTIRYLSRPPTVRDNKTTAATHGLPQGWCLENSQLHSFQYKGIAIRSTLTALLPHRRVPNNLMGKSSSTGGDVPGNYVVNAGGPQSILTFEALLRL